MKKIKVKVPATVANLVCGFDILGMALNDPFDEMELELTEEPGIHITHTDEYNLPEETEKNVAGVALQALAEAYGKPIGFNVAVHKKIKPGSGLGLQRSRLCGSSCCGQLFIG
jgi:homoserine kinase